MKKIFYVFFVLSYIGLFAQGKRFFEDGDVELKVAVEKLNLKYTAGMPFVKVGINGKFYNFLLDTGAPTIISTSVYTELGLEKKHQNTVWDSQKNKEKQIFTVLPEMTVDQVTFKNIGAVVMDFKEIEFRCLNVDGILGANQMAKLFWKINYNENLLEVTKELSKFNLMDYDIVIPFETKEQKTLIVETRILDKKMNLTFDTGFSGGIKITENNYNAKKVVKKIEVFGNNAVGMYGVGVSTLWHIFESPNMTLGDKNFVKEVITTGNSNLIGNEFLKNFIFVLDWSGHKIYMKRIGESSHGLQSFGFGYRFVDSKPIVAYIYQEENFPLKVGDSIISINDVNLDNLDKDSVCHYLQNRIEKKADVINMKIKRNGVMMDVNLKKKTYLED